MPTASASALDLSHLGEHTVARLLHLLIVADDANIGHKFIGFLG